MSGGPGWLSGHIFLRGDLFGGAGDRAVLEVAAPFAQRAVEEGTARRWFFIRYGERGLHLRLRLLAEDPSVEGPLAAALAAHVAAALPAELRGTPGEGPGQALPSGDPSLLWIAYEPEVERYGGMEGVRLAEAFFHASSQAAPALLGGLAPGDRDGRQGRALLVMMLLLGRFTRDPALAVRVAEAHRDNFGGHPAGDARVLELWKRFEQGFASQDAALVERMLALWLALEDRPELPAPLAAYLDGVLALRRGLEALVAKGTLCPGGDVPVSDWSQAVYALAPSYLHMTNNRLGVTPVEEAYLAYLITRTLSPLRG